jgi:hypothetical protein
MSYTMTKGVPRDSLLYNVRDGVRREIGRTWGKRSVLILPLALISVLGVLTLTGHDYWGHRSPESTSKQPAASSSAHDAAVTTPTNTSSGSEIAASKAATPPQTAAPATPLSSHPVVTANINSPAPVVGRGGGDALAPAISNLPTTDIVTSPDPSPPAVVPVTDPVQQASPLPDTTDPVLNKPLACAPKVLAVLDPICL